MTVVAPTYLPIEVTPEHARSDALLELKRQIHESFSRLRESYPQIPGNANGIDPVAGELAKAVQDALRQPGASAATLSRRLQAVQIKGLGQVNRLWPRLFAMVPAPAVASECLLVPRASRTELAEFLRVMFADHFQGRTQQLEWIIASVLAWRPGSLRELHGLFKKADPFFLGVETFAKQYGSSFSFEPSNTESLGAPPDSDWTLLWEYEGQTGYGGAYPEDVRTFLASFLGEIHDSDPKARILDVGTGNHAATLLARSISTDFRLVGIDIADLRSPPEQARIETFRMSAAALGFPEREFAAVISVNGIEYADRNLAFPEMYRVMQPGGRGALVLHRPDSHILDVSRAFIAFLEDSQIMETLAMSWMFLRKPVESAFREIDRQLSKLMKKTVAAEFERYYRAVLSGIPEAIQCLRASPDKAFEVIGRFESDLRWRYERDRFLVSHMASIPVDHENLSGLLERHGFVVDAVEELFMDAAGGRRLAGWGVRLHRPNDVGETRAPGSQA